MIHATAQEALPKSNFRMEGKIYYLSLDFSAFKIIGNTFLHLESTVANDFHHLVRTESTTYPFQTLPKSIFSKKNTLSLTQSAKLTKHR